MTDKKDSKLAELGVIILFIVFGIIVLMSITLLFFTLGIADEAKQSIVVSEDNDNSKNFIYNGRSYYMPEEDMTTPLYVDFSDLGIETLKFVHYNSEIEKEFGIKCSEEYLSMIDNIEKPTTEYTLHYDVWYSKYKFFVDKKEKSILESYDGDIVTPELDYGGQSVYWLGEQLIIRYDDKNLLIFHSDTTPNLLETEKCADFMSTEMRVPKRLNAFDLIFYSDEK